VPERHLSAAERNAKARGGKTVTGADAGTEKAQKARPDAAKKTAKKAKADGDVSDFDDATEQEEVTA